MKGLLYFVLVLQLILTVSAFNRNRIRRNEVKVLSVKTLPDGRKFEQVQESGVMEPLPIEEEIDDINDSRIGHIDESGSILVPVDENGVVLPGYEYLLQTMYVDISVDENDIASPQASRHNLPSVQNPQIVNTEYNPSDEFGEEPPAPVPNALPLPAVDYSDSGESDENLKPDSNEIDIPKNAVNTIGSVANVLIPAKEIRPIPIEYNLEDVEEEEDSKVTAPISEDDKLPIVTENSEADAEDETYSEEGIQEMAEEMSRGVLDHVINKSSEFWNLQDPEAAEKPWRIQSTGQNEQEKPEEIEEDKLKEPEREAARESESEDGPVGGGSDGYVLETPTSEEIEIGNADADEKESPTVEQAKDIVRGNIGLVPDGATTSGVSKILMIFVLLFVTF